MWNKTSATRLLGIEYPIVQGPFGGRFSSARLVSVVSNSGGMGSFGLNSYPPEEILEVNAQIKALTTKPYALNLWVPLKDDPAESYRPEDFQALRQLFSPFFEELNIHVPELPPPPENIFEQQAEAVLRAHPPVMSFIFGVPPKDIIRELKKKGIISIGTATTAEEAVLIEEAGLDLVVASGSEAGGHRASFLKTAEESLTTTFSLLKEVIARVKIPVIAAGGISDGKAIASALKSGASAVQPGTAFLATEESGATLSHKEKLLSGPIETTLTKAYSGRLARVISNTFTKAFENTSGEGFAPYPVQSNFLSPFIKAAADKNREELLAFWSGQPSSALTHRSAEALFKALREEAERVWSNS